MRVHLQREIDKLHVLVLALSAEVEDNVRAAVRSVENRDAVLAHTVIQRDQATDTMEVDIEEECLKILALHQPVASDLRMIIAVLKINQDLERIGDLAAHIAERALFLCSQPPIDIPFRLGSMADKTQQMLKNVLDAFVNLDEAGARKVCAADSAVNAIKWEVIRQASDAIMQTPGRLEIFLQIISIARHLERIADHAVNIAEDLIYLIEGTIVRHQPMTNAGEGMNKEPDSVMAGPSTRLAPTANQ
ncbi:MAG: phosphate signaling complex protein PhoU [Verrucomicrobiota bacterium]